ncbi:Glycerate kinase [Carpediemonas membranifera]|uniref:Glycerate kinase n=1 Tax=Carpediemonas membranifera TaxID=201153 RepID=A0A8J6AVY7_9EUKA|nr:Glycerate kinase [Carpediemonas membranifera]|eukprot:KAG9396166.1 Glycerate kinase [Carpediemonas membranifera]
MVCDDQSKHGTALLCTDSFKGSATSLELVKTISDVLEHHHWKTISLPISDGGDGFLEAVLCAIQSAEARTVTVTGPFPGITAEAPYAVVSEAGATTVFLEMASVAGIILCKDLDPMRTTTFGLGELIRFVIAAEHPSRIHIGLGGSATNDAGLGMLQALGAVISSADGELPSPVTTGDAPSVTAVDLTPAIDAVRGVELIAVCDVSNPLAGPNGATHIYGPQKGVRDLARMDAAIAQIGALYGTSAAISEFPGAGAAGGLGAAVLALHGAIEPGSRALNTLLHLDDHVRESTLVITGEGKYDSQTANGKVVSAVQASCKAHGVACLVLCGCCDKCMEGPGVVSLTSRYDVDKCMRDTLACVKETVEDMVQNGQI